MENKTKAYRAVYAEYVDFYLKGQIDQIPGLEGKNYIKPENERCNNFDYDPETKYLHFFDSMHSAEEFRNAVLRDNPDRKMVILKFELPENLTQKTYLGRYFSFVEMKDVDRKEYIFPADEYRASFCKGEAGDGDKEKNRVYYDPDSYGGGFFGF